MATPPAVWNMLRTLPLLICFALAPAASYGSLVVEIGDVTVPSDGAGTTSASFDVSITNNGASPVDVAGYSFFVDIAPDGLSLPPGLTFDTLSPVTYESGDGTGLFAGASLSGTSNLSPAAGDLGVGQFQVTNAQIPANSTVQLLSVHFEIDETQASFGDYLVSLSASGQNTIASLSGAIPFTASTGTISVAAVPEATASVVWGILTLTAAAKPRRRRAASGSRFKKGATQLVCHVGPPSGRQSVAR